MLNVAMISGWHVHTGQYAEFVNAQPDARVSVFWDDDEARGKMWAEKLSVPYESDLDALLKRRDVDAVLVDAPTSDHARIMLKCAAAGKHIFTEKALAPTVAECEQVAAAIAAAGVKFAISFPWLTYPYIEYMKNVIASGELGKITYLRIRDAHGGSCQGWLPEYWYDASRACGGAMMDLGCHPNYLASYLLGEPRRVNSMFNTVCCPDTMEDNAVSVVEFEGGAIAVLETGFVSPWSKPRTELYGTEGSVIVDDGKVMKRSLKSGIEGWIVPDKLPATPKPAIRQWLDGILYGAEIAFDMDKAIRLTRLLENEYKAHREGRTVEIG